MISDRKTSGVFVKTPVLVQDTYSVEEIAILFRVSETASTSGTSARTTPCL